MQPRLFEKNTNTGSGGTPAKDLGNGFAASPSGKRPLRDHDPEGGTWQTASET